jgi:hypothetical protein
MTREFQETQAPDYPYDPSQEPPRQRTLAEMAEADTDIGKIIEGDGIRAGYKIEVFFGPDRSAMKDYYAFISLMESGKFLHGGGDANMYYCLDCRAISPDSAVPLLMAILDGKEKPDRFGCGHPIINAAMGGGIACCPNCKRMVQTDFLTGQLPFHGTTQDLATFVSRYFDVLKHNADIYCKYHWTDLRYKAMEQAKGLEVARRLRGMFIYPLGRLLADAAGGASVESRLRAFFNA